MSRSVGSKLSWQLLREVLSIYFIITILVTLAQMGIEYLHTRNMIQEELAGVERTFYPAIASALWELNTEQLEALQQGIINLPIITRLKIVDASGREWVKTTGRPFLGDSITHSFKVNYVFAGEDIHLADVTFEASDLIALNRLELGYQMIIVSALVKSTVLTLLFFWTFRRRLGAPLQALTAAVTAINLDQLKRQQIDFRQGQHNELTELENAYNLMLGRLDAERIGYFSKLEHINRNLEQQVAERTRELQLANQRLEALAHTDALTGIANRRRFEETVEREIQRCQRTGSSLAVLMADLDHFKQINDTHGHGVGDLVLCNFTAAVSGQLRATDLLARIGGEEFAILLPETSGEEATEVALRILESVRQQVVPSQEGPVRYTISIGLACLGRQLEEYKDLMRRADEALYQAKTSGRDRVQTEP